MSLSRPEQPRIPPLARDDCSEEQEAVLAPLRREGADLNIFATLARHPQLTRQWLRFGNALLSRGLLPARDREILVLRTGWNCGSEYEWGQHVRIGADAGLGDEEIRRIGEGPEAPGWDEWDATLLRAADELHRDAFISQPVWEALAARYGEQELIELCMVVGQYHLVAFTLNSLGVQREPGVAGFPA